MARPFIAYKPEDRSVNEPSVIASSAQVLGLYNQENAEQRSNVNETVKSWYKDEMIQKYGWYQANFFGNQCVLEAKISIDKNSEV